MDVQQASEAVLERGLPGPIGVGLWRAPLKPLPAQPWAPRKDFAVLSGGKSSTGWRNIWIMGGDAGRPLNDIWRSVDGGGSWEMIQTGPLWGPRSRLSVCGAATDPKQSKSGRPIGIMYVVGGQTHSGLFGDVWASDTAGRSWHRMTENPPFGPRIDVALAVVPPNPLTLVVAGGISVDVHRDLWLSRDAGETFSAVDVPTLPPAPALVQWPPDLLCAAKSHRGQIVLWKLKMVREDEDADSTAGLTGAAVLESLGDEFQDTAMTYHNVPRPPRITIDLELQVALSWDASASCMVAQSLAGDICGRTYRLDDVAVKVKDAHVLCDMDAANVGWETLRHGRVWVLSAVGVGAWASDRTRFREHERFMKLLGVRLAGTKGLPWELWIGRVRAMVLPFRAYRAREAPPQRPGPSGKARGHGSWRVVHRPRVAIRKEPSVSAEVIGAHAFGATVKPVEVQGAWLRLDGDQVGWILSDGAEVGLGKLLERLD